MLDGVPRIAVFRTKLGLHLAVIMHFMGRLLLRWAAVHFSKSLSCRAQVHAGSSLRAKLTFLCLSLTVVVLVHTLHVLERREINKIRETSARYHNIDTYFIPSTIHEVVDLLNRHGLLRN